ncbi:MAG: TonB-dependent receptor [Flavipsychrobacter sp.]|nr:TonB-dependent receptor [Flavipsychrobacter sp.]
MRLHLQFYFLTLFVIASLTSTAATIKGLVIDKESGEPVIGALVVIKGTEYATTTGLDGSYTIKNVPKGEYDISIQYTSFEKYNNHIVISDETQIVSNNIKLIETSSVLNEVQIKGKYKAGTDEEARNLEKNGDNLMNVMSARAIELSPDIIVANVLQRISGVQVERDENGEARYATIRGMDKRYNYTTVDGIKIPSTDDKGRFVPLDIFPAEIVERVEVIKSLTPSMEGDAVGGVTNLELKKAPDHFVIYASAATGYNQNGFNESYNSFDKGSLTAKDPTRMYGNNYSASLKDFPLNSSIIKPMQAPANGLFSLSVGDRFFKNKLGVMLSGSYQNTYKQTDDIFFKPASQPNPYNIPEFDDIDLRKYSTQETRSAIHLNTDYRINDRNTITLSGLYTQLNQWQERNVVDSVITAVNRPAPGLGTVDYKDRTQFIKQSIANLTLRGSHQITNRLKVDWTVAASQAIRDMPDQTEFSTENQFSKDSLGNIKQQGRTLKAITKIWEYTNDQDIQEFVNITYVPTISGKDIEFKVGAMDRNKNRDNLNNEYDINPVGSILYTNVQGIQDASLKLQNPMGTANGNGLSYTVHENIWAYYAQAKLRFFNNKLEALGGVRVENTFVSDSSRQNPQYVVAVSGTYNYMDVLPSLNLKYKLSSKENIRLSYFESISRPGFFELINATTPGEDFDQVGNPYLTRSVAQNIDARYEWFPKGIDQLLVGTFYKSIYQPIEYLLARPTGPSAVDIQPTNLPGTATNYGAEFQITKYFHYFGINANYTYTHSAITDTVQYLQPSSTGQKITSVTETRPLQGQAAHVANLSFIYKNPKLGLDAQINEQYTGRHIYLTAQFAGLAYWQKATFLTSLSVEKRVAKKLFAYAKVNNLLNTPVLIEIKYPNNKLQNSAPSSWLPYQNLKDGQTLVEKTKYGQNYLVGIRYKFD